MRVGTSGLDRGRFITIRGCPSRGGAALCEHGDLCAEVVSVAGH